MAKPNYQFEKRQRDLAKKKKQDEKRSRKLSNKDADTAEPGSGDAPQTDASEPAGEPAAD